MTITCLVDLLVFIATLYLVKYGFDIAMRKMAVPMMVLPFPSGIQYLSFPCGMIFTAVFVLDQLINDVVKLFSPAPVSTPEVKEG